jgi:mannose-6-phosphate isomerase
MADIYKLRNQIKHYEWGSPDLIPRLMGLPVDGSPWAEMWMGSHRSSPSLVKPDDPSANVKAEIALGEFIARDPRRYLGEKTARRFGALPFLFKLLAAEKPLSIQVHPNSEQARAGFERENKAGRPLDAPNRNYKDPNHKPEILCALTPFTGMCGFRGTDEIRQLLAAFVEPSAPAQVRQIFALLIKTLEIAMQSSALQLFFEVLFSFSQAVRKELTDFILLSEIDNNEWRLARQFARLYPCDPAILAPFYLNVFQLEPGEAVFLPACIPHAYIHGFGVELMANSDNVLRAGLTGKHIDIQELMRVLDFNPSKPCIIKPSDHFSASYYPTPCEEFSLAMIRGAGDTNMELAENSPAIGIVTEGEVSIAGMVLKQGESVFIPAAAGNEIPLSAQGPGQGLKPLPFTLFTASVP